MDWDGTFSLTEKADGSAGFVSVNADDILYFRVEQQQIKAHTLDREYFSGWDTLDRLTKALVNCSEAFYRTDRIFLVNLPKIRVIDTEWSMAYFVEKPDSTSKHCYIARMKLSEVKRRVRPQSG